MNSGDMVMYRGPQGMFWGQIATIRKKESGEFLIEFRTGEFVKACPSELTHITEK